MKKQAHHRTLYTTGHSTRSANELIDILHAFEVTCLVDIRSILRSRTNPQFNFDVLAETLRNATITYVHLAALGGLRAKSKRNEEGDNAVGRKDHFATPLTTRRRLPSTRACRSY